MARGVGIVLLLTAVVVLLSGVAAQAQPGRGPGGPGGMMGGGPGAGLSQLLRFEPVQKEIELVDDQKAKLKELGDSTMADMRKLFEGLNDEQRRAKFEELRKQAPEREAELVKKVEGILLPHQVTRLKQLRVQMLGARAIRDEAIAKDLGITEEQKGKLAAMDKEDEDRRAKVREEMSKLSEEERRAKFREMFDNFAKTREEREGKVFGVLTQEQKDKLEQLKGKKADIDWTQMFGRGGPGGRGPGGRGPGGQGGRGPGGQGGERT